MLDGLLGRVDDPNLRAALQVEVDRLRSTKDFGLVFEKHMPENVRLYSHPVRRGLRVEERSGESDATWLVRRVRDGKAILVDADGQESERDVEELVVVRQFGEPIYPGLKSVGRIERGGDKPFHTVINGENYHALETLLYAYEGKVDCIYIDPPYNTGAKDWKYNNDYVAADDAYRHSKWLSFMERRLELAKRLLNPEDSVLIVTIDEKEVHHLALLIETVFPNSVMQMVTSVINPKGTPKRDYFARVEEYLLFVNVGAMIPVKSTQRMLESRLAESDAPKEPKVRWASLRRSGGHSRRVDTEVKFYPLFVDPETGHIISVGDRVPKDLDINSVSAPDGQMVQWPIRPDGTEGCWQVSDETLRTYLSQGRVQVGTKNKKTGFWTYNYLMSSDYQRVQSGEIEVLGRAPDGSLRLGGGRKAQHGKTVWNLTSHSATDHGTSLLRLFLPGRSFPYPKSLYAVEDALRFYVGDRPRATVIDFFGGSGTTAHAVMRLNRQDGGRRRSIVVTNNEVSVDEAKELREKGLSPGDPMWEAQGIFQHITKPRIEAAVTGVTHTGAPVKGDYKFTDEFPMADGFEENVEFVELTYLDRNDISRGKAFETIAPLLWLKVGSQGEMIAKQTSTFAAPAGARYAVLFDIDVWPKFVEAIRGRDDLEHVFIVTDSLAMYQQVVAELPAELATTMLYEDYLRNFEINMGGAQ